MPVKVVDLSVLEKSKNIAVCIQESNLSALPASVSRALECIKKTGDLFKPSQQLHVLYPTVKGIERIFVYALDKSTEISEDHLRNACACIVKKATQLKVASLTFDVASFSMSGLPASDTIWMLSLISMLADYRYDEFKPGRKKEKTKPLNVFLAGRHTGKIGKTAEQARLVAAAINQTRDLANRPANQLFPQRLAVVAKQIAKRHGKLHCKVMQKEELVRKGFGALMAVGAGSQKPPVLIEMSYQGGKAGQPPIALVGKGVTFDSGGISLKPSAKMDEMRYDMSGAAAVLGLMQSAAALKLPVNLIGIIPAAENMPSGSASRPGDIVKSLSGQTIEILNTDAEGRLILADALTYAKKYNPKSIIDFATLTGAVIVALGHVASGLVSNNDTLANGLEQAGKKTGEKVWRMPLWEEYKDLIKSENADMANIGHKPGAGTIVGAVFLERFVGKTPWAHLDIAGTAWGIGGPLFGKGATGVGIRIVLEWLLHQ